MKKLLVFLMIFMFLFTGCGNPGGEKATDGMASQSVSPVEGKKIAYIQEVPLSPMAMW